jgi:hypothetical protein
MITMVQINVESVTDTQPNTRATARVNDCWTLDEDTKLTSTIANTCKKHWGSIIEQKIDWVAVAVLVQGRTNNQCNRRWNYVLDPNRRNGSWTEDEDSKLKGAVHTQGSTVHTRGSLK